jgi:hypothetical protein
MKISLRGLRVLSSDPKTCTIPEDYVEIVPKYIRLFRGVWLKYTDKRTGLSYPGGFLIDFGNGMATLRNIKQQVSELSVSGHVFFCKNDLDIYKAVRELIIEWERVEAIRKFLNSEKNHLLEEKRKFYLIQQTSADA